MEHGGATVPFLSEEQRRYDEITDASRLPIQKLFGKLDVNGSGFLDMDEMKALVRRTDAFGSEDEFLAWYERNGDSSSVGLDPTIFRWYVAHSSWSSIDDSAPSPYKRRIQEAQWHVVKTVESLNRSD